eukprot:TRINITY_DN1840_c0_g3_i1.p1 TRINITY_DN1840_c0_g3~~TRINITY_DN1840_c0_g3_i1.p1  ORF type:complete len:513 (+),score=75.56 TRINITY_DN1840_c0_g3_i1:75-1613(+)
MGRYSKTNPPPQPAHPPRHSDVSGGESYGADFSEAEETRLIPKPNTYTPENFSFVYRLFLVTVALIESLLCSGVIFGWPPLLLVLQKEKIYSDLCPINQPNTCDEQEEKLNLIFVVASTCFSCCVLPLGWFLDWAGPRLSLAVGSAMFLAGCLLFGFSSNGFDAFLEGFILIGISGPPIVFSFLHLSNLFPRQKGLIITLFNVALDASSLDYFVLELLNDYLGVPRKFFFIGYAIIPAVMLLTIWLWPTKPYLHPVISEHEAAEGRTSGGEEHKLTDHAISDYYGDHLFRDQIWTGTFLFGCLFTALQLLRINFYIGTVEYQLENIDRDNYKLMTQLFSVILPIGGVLSAPIVGWLLDKQGIVTSVSILILSGVIYGILSLFTHVTIWFQIATFLVVAFFRAILFSSMAHYVSLWFGFANFGKLWGIVFFVAGVINLGLYFLVKAINTYFDGDFFYPNAVLTGLSFVLFVFVGWLWSRVRRISYQMMNEANDSDEESDPPPTFRPSVSRYKK